MNRAAILAGALNAFLCVAQEQPVFRAGVSLVHTDAEVTDGARILTGFQKEDFRILDNGQPQPILAMSQEEKPLDIILLFDTSGSMRLVVQKVAATARVSLAELQPGDRVAVMAFSWRSRLVAPFTGDLDAVERAIQQDVLRMTRGGTRILAAVDDAAKYFLQEPRTERRRAVLIITDNFGQKSRRESTVVGSLWEADAMLCGLIVRSAVFATFHTINTIQAPWVRLLEEGMTHAAEKTGGDVVKAGDPGTAFQEMMHRIRQRYSLYYAMPEGKPGEQRKITVMLSEDARQRYPQGRVRARTGYRIPKGEGRLTATGQS